MRTTTVPAIAADHLIIVREPVKVLQDVTFTVPEGSITGLIGPSGSGKTTLIRAIVGAQRITLGALHVLGQPAGSAGLRTKIGYMTQSPAIYDDLTVRQNLHYFAVILGLGAHDVDKALDAVHLAPQADRLASMLSGGQRARVSLAIALLGEPPLLVLDEPTVGLDPVLRRSLWTLFRKLADAGRTLLISSHVMEEAEQCPNILMLRDGQVLFSGAKAALLTSTHTKSVEEAFITLAGDVTEDENES